MSFVFVDIKAKAILIVLELVKREIEFDIWDLIAAHCSKINVNGFLKRITLILYGKLFELTSNKIVSYPPSIA